MDKKTKLFGMTALTLLLAACGGGGGSGGNSNVYVPPNVPDPISPEVPSDLVPFEEEGIIEKIKALLSGESNSSKLANDYNEALAHMIGEVFADYPIGRTGRVVQIYNVGVNSIKYPNLLCADITTSGNTKTLTLKEHKDSCIILDKTLKAGSKIIQTTNGDTTTVQFINVRYGSNVDFNLKDQYLIDGSLKLTSSKSSMGKTKKFETSNLSFQRVTPTASAPSTADDVYSATSREYLKLVNYEYKLEDDFGNGPNGTRKLSTKGTVIGQPFGADFRYTFDFDTGFTPFIMDEISLDNYHHLPREGSVAITHKKGLFSSNLITKVTQESDRSLKAAVYLKNEKVADILWSTIVGEK
ncbi:hypothetical protein A3K93_04685 [Acinetobacter sp. NCu2D-2]|uniref:hypothetical protein n=1 Tax=Acinetobacter sp. NCu2D-2 TaxID=1608473 RepID=UPI0007CDDE31|nr:hypothetical protein [Acinetobacter sp. NCu2D-2]ANF81555.1 hypothetical protein A3K93_04685 [Acinetobacter sp. NCu2D-2]